MAPPPPPQATQDDLKDLEDGTARADVLKLGAPAARITMYEDGHLVEIYRYQSRDTTLGVVRLSDGSVSERAGALIPAPAEGPRRIVFCR